MLGRPERPAIIDIAVWDGQRLPACRGTAVTDPPVTDTVSLFVNSITKSGGAARLTAGAWPAGGGSGADGGSGRGPLPAFGSVSP